jgi:hypothetical protein
VSIGLTDDIYKKFSNANNFILLLTREIDNHDGIITLDAILWAAHSLQSCWMSHGTLYALLCLDIDPSGAPCDSSTRPVQQWPSSDVHLCHSKDYGHCLDYVPDKRAPAVLVERSLFGRKLGELVSGTSTTPVEGEGDRRSCGT